MGYQGASSKRQSAVLGLRGQFVAAFARLAVTLSATLALAACAAPSSYMDISFTPGQTASDLQDLARRAQAGDKQAQLDLGIAYEEGLGVPVDLKRAFKLYAQAATTTGGTTYVYQSSPKKGGRGGVVPVNTGTVVKGLDAARVRLERTKENRDTTINALNEGTQRTQIESDTEVIIAILDDIADTIDHKTRGRVTKFTKCSKHCRSYSLIQSKSERYEFIEIESRRLDCAKISYLLPPYGKKCQEFSQGNYSAIQIKVKSISSNPEICKSFDQNVGSLLFSKQIKIRNDMRGVTSDSLEYSKDIHSISSQTRFSDRIYVGFGPEFSSERSCRTVAVISFFQNL